MKIGFFIKWPKNLSSRSGCNVLGDSLYAQSMSKELLKSEKIESVNVFTPDFHPKKKLDFMIYLNDTPPIHKFAKRHVLYIQNGYGEGSDKALQRLSNHNYDGYAFISNKLLNIHKKCGNEGIFLPFGVDIDFFYPRDKNDLFTFDVGYIGNDIKGESRTIQYLLPAVKYNFGLYGNWNNPKPSWKRKLQFWNPLENIPEYRSIFCSISKGKIPQKCVPYLYSNVKINLNCTLQDCVDWDVITLRTFEVLACKGFLITDKTQIAEKTMQECMVFTDGYSDLSVKIDYYLNHEKERKRYAQRGYNYIKDYASLQSRMNVLISYLERLT